MPIEKIWINPKSRDDIPAVLKGLQHIWGDEELRARLLTLLDEHILPEGDRTVGRPGMDLWQILVLGVLKQGLGCDFDRLHDLTNHHGTIREFLGHGDFDDKTRYEYQTHLVEQFLDLSGQMAPLTPPAHRVLLSRPARLPQQATRRVPQQADVRRVVHVRFNHERITPPAQWLAKLFFSDLVTALHHQAPHCRQQLGRQQGHVVDYRVEAYVERCRGLVERMETTLDALRDQGVGELRCRSITGLVAHARRQIDQVERRLLRGETIPHEEKVFSIFEGHTRWISKGKAGTPVELGVPVAVIEDQYQFILHHKVLWEGEDVDVAVPMVQEAQALYPELRACSFDRGFHSRGNRVRLDALLDVNALPGKGYLSKADREREEEESFAAARRAHPAIESAINGLEHRGLDRVRSHGADGFARTVALSVLAANLHRIGLILQKRERKRQRQRLVA